MRKILLAVAIISSLVIASTASAAQNRTSTQASGARKGPVAKLVELEKRKNEWLRQQFLNKYCVSGKESAPRRTGDRG